MESTYRASLLLLTTTLLCGCSGKNITLQDYADTWFNEKGDTKEIKEKREEPKKNPAADIAWSSTSKADVHNKGQGAMQKSLDAWTKEEWEPAFEGDANQTQRDKEASEHFTLQHYIDKAGTYMDKKEAENAGEAKEPSHYDKIKSLPVIGK